MMVCVVGTAIAQPVAATAASSAASTGTAAPWAWGGVRVVGISGTAGPFPYYGTLLVGASVIVHQSNSSSSNYALTVTRTAGFYLNVTFCTPNCKSPAVTATLQHHAWEVASVTANLSTAGTVTVGALTVPALALVSSNGSAAAHVRESGAYWSHGTLELQRNLSIDLVGNWGLQLAPSLGLVPLNVTGGESWTAASTFTLSGALGWTYGTIATGPLATSAENTSGHGSANLNATGAVALAGTDSGSTVHFGHVTYPALNVTLTGPFSLREGFLLLPIAADLFGGSGQSWNTNETAGANATAAAVEVTTPIQGTAHLGFVASGLMWSSKGKNPAPSSLGVLPASAPAAASNATFVQSSPESVDQATAQGNCLSSGLGCPVLGGPTSPLTEEIVALSITAGTVALLVALITERRRLPPPPYPNAELYPPGSMVSPSAPSPPAPPAPPSDDDPLSHLW